MLSGWKDHGAQRTAVRRLFAGLAAGLSAVALGGPDGLAATPGTPYDLIQDRSPEPQDAGRFGERHAAAKDDLDGDGVNDYFVGVPNHDAADASNADADDVGRVYAVSGRSRSVVYSIAPPEPQASAKFGFFIQNIGDVSGDGDPDLAVGTQTQDTTAAGDSCTPPAAGCNANQGKVWVFNGRTRVLLYDVIPPPEGQVAGAQFGSRLGNAGDINANGIDDLIAGATGVGGNGRAYIFEGSTGALLRTLEPPDANPTPGSLSFGLSVQGPGDVDGDGVTDQLVDAAGYTGLSGRMYLFSGSTGAVLARIDNPAPQPGAFFGFQDAAPRAPGDVNGDGHADIYANGFASHGLGGAGQGRMWVFDGRATVAAGSGVVLYEPRDPTPHVGGQCCFSLDRTDYNADGRPDLYVGQSPHHLPAGPCAECGSNQSGGTYVFDGRDGSLLKALELGSLAQSGSPGNLGSNLGWSAIAPGDLNSDGLPDYVGGAPFQDVGSNKDEGSSFAFLSRAPGAAGPPSRDGFAPFAGCPKTTANIIRGSAGSDVITATVRGDRIFAGTGNDKADALTGHDCVELGPGADRGQGGPGRDLMLGGLGRDRISGSAGNDRLRGGPGLDRLLGGFGNDRLHGESAKDSINASRGRDRIHGGSGPDVISAGSSNDRVHGDRGNDRINGNSGNDVLRGNSGRDRITGSTGKDRILAGFGNDRINARDGQRDRINCGRGRDRVRADRLDRVMRSCERVRRR